VTKIYTYCLFDEQDTFFGVYSSLQAIHRDAVKMCNRGNSAVTMEYEGKRQAAHLATLRNILKGQCDVQVRYRAGRHGAKIIKTKLKE
jgi:enoyl-[acyl-carrier-protein] reductase (NADH)|tara:strand:- start:502 stop:765 length:264 start_codon:yes stop_codon:yes gene_type:complete